MNSPRSLQAPSGPAWPAPSCPAWPWEQQAHMLSLSTTETDLLAAHVKVLNLRELVQLAALLLVGGPELLVLHSEPLLLQHDLLVQTGGNKMPSEIP